MVRQRKTIGKWVLEEKMENIDVKSSKTWKYFAVVKWLLSPIV